MWVADATRIPCGEGVFWLAAVRDVFSNRIVGWRCSDRCDTDLILGALEYGLWSRDVRDGQLIHHSDRGSNYTSFGFAQRLADNGILPSMGSVGDSFDNALMENFWSTLKIELVYRNSWRTRDEAENAIFTYIDGWYNTRRSRKTSAGDPQTSTKPPGTPTRHSTTRRLSFSLSPPAPGNQPSGKPGEPQRLLVAHDPLDQVDRYAVGNQPGRNCVPQIVEPHPAGSLGRDVGDRFPPGRGLRRPLDTVPVGPDSAVRVGTGANDLAEQAGADQRGKPDPAAKVRPVQRTPDPVPEDEGSGVRITGGRRGAGVARRAGSPAVGWCGPRPGSSGTCGARCRRASPRRPGPRAR